MFRKMRRFKQQISDEECIEVLKNAPRGVLSMIGDEGYPYGIPIDHWYCEEDGKLYFHGAKEGHKIDSLMKSDKVSFVVMDEGFRKEGEWALNIKSVIIFGRMKFVNDPEKAKEIGINLCRKFTDDEEYIQREITQALPRAQFLELIPEHMTGKLVNES
ncbi:MAG: pyridoxamine 5'-phosphate oxidase family protein [Clostridia bacterium]|nr:pyridoxamine 5'-phosphate oxidase family protein [Clostridia bacterium]